MTNKQRCARKANCERNTKERTKERRMLHLTNDLVFKAVFGQDLPESKKALTRLLNLILERKDNPTMEITYKNPFIIAEDISVKSSIMDIKITTSLGEIIGIEMQGKNTGTLYLNRSIFYASKLGMKALKAGEEYDMLKQITGIHLLKESLPFKSNFYHKKFLLTDQAQDLLLSQNFQIHFLELPLANPKKKPIEEMDELEQFCVYTYYVGKDDEEAKEYVKKTLHEGSSVVRMTHRILKKISEDELMREKEEAREMYLHDQASELKYAAIKGREEGERIGEDRISRLYQRLIADGKMEDLKKAASDPEHRKGLLNAYGL